MSSLDQEFARNWICGKTLQPQPPQASDAMVSVYQSAGKRARRTKKIAYPAEIERALRKEATAWRRWPASTANENFPYAVVRQLRSLGHDTLTIAEAGNAGQRISDKAMLAYATQAKCAVLTINRRDFVRLHRQGTSRTTGLSAPACTSMGVSMGRSRWLRSTTRGAPGSRVRVTCTGDCHLACVP